MRRLLIAAAVALAALVGVAAPASANHDNWAWSYNVDVAETDIYVDAYFHVIWNVGSSGMNACPTQHVSIQNRRPDVHSVRIQYLSRASGFVAWDVVLNGIQPGELRSFYPPGSLIAISSEPYIRYRWGDGAYGWRDVDYFYNWNGDTNNVHSDGYYC